MINNAFSASALTSLNDTLRAIEEQKSNCLSLGFDLRDLEANLSLVNKNLLSCKSKHIPPGSTCQVQVDN